MWTEIAIALVVIAAAGTAFLVLRGGASPRPSSRHRQIETHRRRRRQARTKDASQDDGIGEANPTEDRRPGTDAISRWSDSA
ncbi:hypothetical protein GGP96_002640 [Salinibacter ruber]|jgi:hypothetical protein|uniref:Uncharacterized protein n=1 Tax=Salinibacter ruber TaxID=146919 RepID=A0A9X2U437_9BACT|nr:hypothetical protein [Salinibacter ruber]MCS3866496.1 hypothetical protein [Salinibacter ruber]MCS4151756.1 hypothetical protein [Salinibacter ruber]MCS4177900.1 hypothetical protein [Salinibacter ruber]